MRMLFVALGQLTEHGRAAEPTMSQGRCLSLASLHRRGQWKRTQAILSPVTPTLVVSLPALSLSKGGTIDPTLSRGGNSHSTAFIASPEFYMLPAIYAVLDISGNGGIIVCVMPCRPLRHNQHTEAKGR